MCEWSLKFCLVSCIKAALALDAVIWFHFHPLPGCLCQAERGSWRRMLSCVLHSCFSWKPREVPDFHSSGCILPDELLLWHINNRESSELQHLWHHCGASATTGTWEFVLQYLGSEKSDTPFTSMGNSRAEMGKCICVPAIRKIGISRLLTAGKLSIQWVLEEIGVEQAPLSDQEHKKDLDRQEKDLQSHFQDPVAKGRDVSLERRLDGRRGSRR